MRFFIEQVAIATPFPAKAKKLLSEISALAEWHEDRVQARGEVFGRPATNVANLSFNYGLGVEGGKALEFEVLHYIEGDNWMQGQMPSVSHFGMHCTAEELVEWRAFFAARHIDVAQEVMTESHTNPVIKDTRRYNYVIFDTRLLLGVDLKFIVRHIIG